jgi:hypothetical protein
LKDNPDLCREIEIKLRKRLGLLREESKDAQPGAPAQKAEGKEEERRGRAATPAERPSRPPAARP